MAALLVAFIRYLGFITLLAPSLAFGRSGKPQLSLEPLNGAAPQSNVTWDERSLFVNGQRVLFYSGEFHPFRLPVPSLWLDIFQKIRSMGYTGVSFYVDWALLEGKQGKIHAEGSFALEPFFEAAAKAGVYLIARPGPYINAEVSGGGFPGWLQRNPGHFRTTDEAFLNATELYVKTVGKIIAKAQITNGGPVILFQPENEYTNPGDGFPLQPEYFQYVIDQYRQVGITVPMVSNDAAAKGNNAPGGPGAADIYGHDGYPLGFDCSNPTVWGDGKLPTNWYDLHMEQSPNTPYTIPEFQGGSFDPWGGPGFEKCTQLINSEFERVFWKNLYSFGVTVYSVYMTYGGTNWGNIGHPGGYTSYDYGSVITEDRLVYREKYGEAKVQANGLLASPAYLTAVPQGPRTTEGDDALTISEVKGNPTRFFVVRHSAYSSTDTKQFRFLATNTSAGDLQIPQTNGTLTLQGRDSKIYLVDFDLNGINLVYSTAEIFTLQKYGDKQVLVVYVKPNEQNEMAFDLPGYGDGSVPTATEGLLMTNIKGKVVVSWETLGKDQMVKLGPLTLWIVDRSSAYNHWVLPLKLAGLTNTPYVGQVESSIIIKGGYLMRNATVRNEELALVGDTDKDTGIEIRGGAPVPLRGLSFNGKQVEFKQDMDTGVVKAEIKYKPIESFSQNLADLDWQYTNSLPEIDSNYSDRLWTKADKKTTENTKRNLTTPTSLYGGDYGNHAGSLLFRGHFTATGSEKSILLNMQGGSAFGFSVWLNDGFLGSFAGNAQDASSEQTFDLPALTANETAVFTIVMDHMGLDENWTIGEDDMKNPRGILHYVLNDHEASDVEWKITGNLGGEDYLDLARGPLNEGGMYGERNGFHLPKPPSGEWTSAKGGPTAGISNPGIAWYTATLDLDLPHGYDIPLSLQLGDTIRQDNAATSAYRVQIFVNGWQFGKYVHHIGPQTKFPVPEGIWDYHGKNYLAVSLWAMDEGGAKLDKFELVAGHAIQSGYGPISVVDSPAWTSRKGAY